MEAQLKQTDRRSPDTETDRDEVLRQARLLAGIDRYLLAAGVTEATERYRLVSNVSLHLKDGGATAAGIDWRAVIDASDAVLTQEHGIPEGGESQPACFGRVARGLSPDVIESAARNWGTPPPMPSAMPAQDLSIRRLKVPRLAVPQSWRQAQTLAAALCCLPVVLLP